MEAKITEAPMETTQLLGLNVTFSCTATGIPIPFITWSSDNEDMINANNVTILDDITIFSEILLVNVGMDDFVNYTCTATNRFNMVNASAMLINASMTISCYNMSIIIMQFIVSAIPIITQPPEDAIVLLGGEVTFSCMAIGVPAPNITWSSETNGTINATTTVTMETYTISTLTLTNLMSTYFNQSYICIASNEHGMVNSSAFLQEGSEL